jgi:predicted amidophosphoribosyltransferase
VRQALRELLSLLAPPRCAACAAVCSAEALICLRCRAALGEAAVPAVLPPPGLDATWACAPHEGVARALIVSLKFRGLLSVAELLAERLAERAPREILAGTVVPVPAAPSRLLRRGFDPAEAIAVRLAAIAELPCGACLRRSDGHPQVGRGRAARLADPPRVWAAGKAPRRALLVDDVQTTGATLSACARALRRAGAERVSALTFARSI